MLGINDDPVTIKAIELSIIDRAFDEGWIVPRAAGRAHRQDASRSSARARRPGRRRAAEPRRPPVTVFERADRIGGLLRYGIPEFKMEKRVLDRRLDHDGGRGRRLPDRTRTSASTCPSSELRREFDAIVLAGGATAPRDLPVPGRELDGHPLRDGVPDAAEPPLRGRRRSPTSEFITRARASTSSSSAAATPAPTASAPRTARARASVHQLELLPRPPDAARAGQPVAAVAEHLPRVVGARRGRRARLRGLDRALHRRRARPARPRSRRPGRDA